MTMNAIINLRDAQKLSYMQEVILGIVCYTDGHLIYGDTVNSIIKVEGYITYSEDIQDKSIIKQLGYYALDRILFKVWKSLYA